MLKKFANVFIAMMFSLTVCIPCYAGNTDIQVSKAAVNEENVSPHIVVPYYKTVNVMYPATGGTSIPSTYYYTEWSEEYKTQCSGWLKMVHSTTVGSLLQVTHGGDLTGRI